MTHIKYLLISVFLAATLTAHARETNNVWMPFPGGNLDTICRKIWELYDTKYQTNTIWNVKAGASGEIASRDMLDSPARNKSICAGVTMLIYNQYLFPDIKTHGEDLEMLVRVITLPSVWYVPPTTPSVKNLNELVKHLRALERPINIGTFQGANRTMAQYLSQTYDIPINVVMFKNAPQMYPSLTDGSLDLAFDGGGGVRVAEETGKFKVAGHVSNGRITVLRGYPNFGQNNPEINEIGGWFGIAVARTADTEFKSQLTKRIVSVVQQDSFRAFADASAASVQIMTGQALADSIKKNHTTVKKYWP